MARVNGIIVIVVVILFILMVILYSILKLRESRPADKNCFLKQGLEYVKPTYRCTSPPMKPINYMYEDSEDSIKIEWIPDPQAQSYIIFWATHEDFDYKTESVGSHATTNNIVVLSKSLFCGGLFHFRLIAVNDCGQSEPSDSFAIASFIPEYFKICSKENNGFCLSGTFSVGNVWNVPNASCEDGGCVWSFDDSTGQISIAQYPSECIYQNGVEPDVDTCSPGPLQEFEFDLVAGTICNVDTGDCLRSDQSSGETIQSDIDVVSNTGGNRFEWVIKCADEPPTPIPVI